MWKYIYKFIIYHAFLKFIIFVCTWQNWVQQFSGFHNINVWNKLYVLILLH